MICDTCRILRAPSIWSGYFAPMEHNSLCGIDRLDVDGCQAWHLDAFWLLGPAAHLVVVDQEKYLPTRTEYVRRS